MRGYSIVLAVIIMIFVAPAPAQTTLPPTSADWIVLGDQPTGSFGTHVASAGDVDGDGYDDVLIGDWGYDGAFVNSGRITFYRGSLGGPATTPAWILEGNAAFAGLHMASPAGDVNGDGYDDVVVRDESSLSLSLYLGSPTGPTPASWSIPGTQAEPGDINADGFSDLAVFSGANVLVFHGSSAGLPASPATSLTVPSDLMSPLLDEAFEDLNGDGYDDLALTWRALKNTFILTSTLSVYIGSADGLAQVPKRNIQYKERFLDRWAAIASAGDVDGDGFGDLALSLWGDGLQDAFWLRGGPSGLHSHKTFVASTPAESIHTGSVQGLGDFNGDAYPDLIVPYFDFSSRSLRIFAGSPGGYSSVPLLTVEPAGGQVGTYSVAAAGDVNGDGLGDLIAGEEGFHNGALVGRVILFLGRTSF